MDYNFTILQWNCQSIRGRTAELVMELKKMAKLPDVIALQETWLKDGQAFKFPGYNIAFLNRSNRRGGGVATLLRDGISFNSQIIEHTSFESLLVTIQSRKGANINIVNNYIPPQTDVHSVQTSLHKSFTHTNSIIVGDFNAYSVIFGAETSDKRGQLVENLIDQYGLVALYAGSGTHLTTGGRTTPIDLSICSPSLARKASCCVWPKNMGSDHYPILISLNEVIRVEKNDRKVWSLGKANWEEYQRRSYYALSNLPRFTNLEDATREVTNSLTEAASASIPVKGGSRFAMKPVRWWNSDCAMAIKARNQALYSLRREYTTAGFQHYRDLKSIAQKVVKTAKENHWRNFCSSLNNHSKLGDMWRAVKGMTHAQTSFSVPALKLADGRVVFSDKEKADVLATAIAKNSSEENLDARFALHKNAQKERIDSTLQTGVACVDDPHGLNVDISAKELREALHRGGNGKSPGPDDICYEMLRRLDGVGFGKLLELINLSWSQGEVPLSWRQSTIVPLLKPGKNPSDTNSYRPISLTSSLCKVTERVVANRLRYYLESNQLLNREQSGFRKKRGCSDHILRLQNDLKRSMWKGGGTLAVFLDLEKAFDMVWRDGLLLKLVNIGVKGRMIKWIKSFLSNREARVRVGSTLSDPVSMVNGTPQGSVMSPLLFLVMMSDIPSDEVDGLRTSVFADDVAVWVSGKDAYTMHERLQTRLDEIQKFFLEWGFKVSVGKSVAVCFTKNNGFRHATPCLKMDGSELGWKNEVTFLGVTFDSRLSWNKHMDRVVDRCKKRLNVMRGMTGHNWGCCKTTLMLFYRCAIRSVMEYGCEAFDSASVSVKKRLDRLQHSALKTACRAMASTSLAALQVECGDPPLDLRRKMHIASLASKTRVIADHPCREIFERPPRGKGVRWQQFFLRRVKESEQPAAKRVLSLNAIIDRLQPVEMVPPTTPPWLLVPPLFDDSLVGIKKNDPAITQRARELIHTYRGHTRMYTDASKTEDKVAIGVCVPEKQYSSAMRVTNNVSILTAELTAIKFGLEWMANPDGPSRLALFTDSYSSVLALQDSANANESPLVASVLKLISKMMNEGKEVTLIWIPSHMGIGGNDTADRLAKDAIEHPEVDFSIPIQVADAKRDIRTQIFKEWQDRWDSTTTSRHLWILQSQVSGGIKFATTPRQAEVAITRLRLGKCRLNHYLQEIGCHETGLCDFCGKDETIAHWLLECESTAAMREKFLGILKGPLTAQKILQDKDCRGFILKWTSDNDIEL